MCVGEKGGLLFLPSQLVGKFPVNIWVLRNINCDGSVFWYSLWTWQVLSADRMYLGFSSAMQTHSWKFQKIETKQNKSPLLEPGRSYMRHHYCKSCFAGEIHRQILQWIHFTGARLALGTCSIMATRGLRFPCQHQPWQEVDDKFEFHSSLFPHKYLHSP